jgi:hypothetical protein
LREITSLAVTPPTIPNTYVFNNVSKNIPVHVPCESEAAYKTASGWKVFTNYTDCISNSLNDIAEVASINLYPNPANDKLFVEGEGYEQIKIYDLLGKVVLTAEGVKEIDVFVLAKGVYNVQLLSNKGNVVGNKKIVKQ